MIDLTKSATKNQDYGDAFNKWPRRGVWVLILGLLYALPLFDLRLSALEAVLVPYGIIGAGLMVLGLLKRHGEIVELRGRCNDLQDAVVELREEVAQLAFDALDD